MRKRLIEKFTKSKEGSLGYTMTELLVVVAIIAIVAAIAIPSVIAISRALKFKRVNDHAKSIFLAAQQNLTEMRSDGGLKPLQSAEGAGMIPASATGFPDEFRTEYVYTTTGTDAFELILPAGSVDGTVRTEQIIIEYNPITGNVYSVFYCEDDDQAIAGKYSSTDLPREDKSARKDMMLGYYDGSGLNSSQLEMEEVRATVEFVNGEEGIVRVLVPVPDDFFGNLDEYAKAMTINLTVTGEYSMVQAAAGAAEGESGDATQSSGYTFSLPIKVAGTTLGENCYVEYGNTIVVEYPIDSLVNYGSFANYSSTTYDGAKTEGGTDAKASLTELMDETRFTVLPGENITLEAEVKVDSEIRVEVENGILSGVNPMFEYLQPDGSGGYILAVSNGRNLQNLNAIAPTIAKQVSSVVFTDDIYWNDTVSYYNDKYDTKTAEPGYQNAAAENPARALPYFVPIHHEDLFGTAKFIFPGEGDGGLGGLLEDLKEFFDKIGEVIFGGFNNPKVPSLTDELDAVRKNQDPDFKHADIQGNGHKVYNLNIDSNAYAVPETVAGGKFYAVGEHQIVDYFFTGLFGYVNTPIDDLHVVNPIIKGHAFDDSATPVYETEWDWTEWDYVEVLKGYINQYNNPATGALVGVGGYDTVITNCSTYIDKDVRGYVAAYLGHGDFDATAKQTWYGVSGEGAVGGLVGYAKSHRAVNGALTNNKAHLAFSGCFAAVPVSGNMRTTYDKDFGYSNGVGAFIGNSQLTNFYNCYASGDVRANGCMVRDTDLGSLSSSIAQIFGVELDLLYNGRTSWGAGGFVGSSHGTCYTNCFATGDVSATSKRAGKGAGGFVGVMSLDETSAYGNDALDSSGNYITDDDDQIAQRTVFTNCYAVGAAVTDGTSYENFSGANGRIVYDPRESMTYFIGDYYRLYAPYYHTHDGQAPVYGESFYIYRDTYYLSRNVSSAQNNSRSCAEPTSYEVLQNLTGVHTLNSAWSVAQLGEVKKIPTYEIWLIFPVLKDYEEAYFDKHDPELENKYLQLYAEGYSTAEWEAATAATTHPYTLSAGGAVYPFTKLKGMDYYGDWPAKPSDIGMAYYEQYVGDDNTYYIFDKERGDTDTRLALKDGEDVVVKKDGYAVFSASQQDLTITIGKVSKTLKWSGETFTIEGKKYYSFLFSDELMEAGTAANEFYTAVTARHGGGTTYTMYFNPGVAISHVNPANGAILATKPDAAPKTIYVRSARQFKAIASLSEFWGDGYSYIQQLNINATEYEGWGTDDYMVKSIGNAQKPFNASYSAGYTLTGDIAKQYKLSGFLFADNAAGFFGTIGEKGSVENLIVECASVSVGGTTVSDVAVLAGKNQGTISNVDLTLSGTTTLTAQDNAGLMAGYSSGTIRNCEVSAVAVTVNAKNGGGLIGCAEGTADAEAVVSSCVLTLTGNLTISGSGAAGGLIGSGSYVTLTGSEPLVTMTNLTANSAAYAGGLAGWMENSEIKITDVADKVTVTATTVSNSGGYAAGVLGGGKNVAMNGVDVIVDSVTGKNAAGFLGTGTNVDAEYCDTKISTKIKGTEQAAGVACTIGAQSVFNFSPVDLSGVTVEATAGDAAGYAVEITKEANVSNSNVKLEGTAISASGNAAGFACTVAGDVFNSSGSSVITSVVGKGTISGANAAGFACDITGQVTGAFVTPAKTSAEYLGNSNNNLVVKGTTSAAGFALSVGADATVSNCYALNEITGGTVTGFVATNKGTITGCMANVTISGGKAFIATNDGIVTRCYGWYGDGDASKTDTTAEVGGKVYSAYFVDLNPVDKEGDIVTLYAADGTIQIMTATELQGAANTLASSNYKWYTTGYESYPYTAKPANMSKYLYPMLRDHYGDWVMPPQYAYGVAYYETYEVTASAAEPADAADAAEAAETPAPTTTTVVKLHMVDLSDSTVTEEKQAISTYLVDQAGKVTTSATTVFNNEYTIKTSGYAVFGKKGANVLASMSGSETPLFTYTLSNNKDAKNITYEFFPLKTDSAKDGVVTIGATAVSKNTAAVQTWFADAINVTDNTYRVRTPEQLANVAQTAAASFNFSQTHDIAVTDFTTVEKLSGNYAGNGLKLSVSGQTKTWLSEVAGTVQNLNLVVSGGVNAPVFGTVSGTVTLSGLEIGAIGENGALATAVNGTMTVPAITTPAVSGKLFGDSTGSINTGAITVNGDAAALFSKVTNAETGAISVTGKADQVFGNTTGTVKTGTITVSGSTGKVFGNVESGTVSTGAVTVQNVSGQVFGNMNGTVTVGAVSTREIGTAAQGETAAQTANIFGNVTGGSVTVASINTNGNAVNGNVFGEINGTVNVGTVDTADKFTGGPITTGAVTGNVFGKATAAIKTGDITVNGNAGNVFCDVAGATTGKIEVNGNANQVFGAVSGNVTVNGQIKVTGNVTGNVFGEVNANTTVDSINVGEATQIFGNVTASVTVTNGISTAYEVTGDGETTSVAYGDVGQVFGAITLDANETVEVGGITAGNVTGNVFGDITGGTVTTGNIQVTSLGGKLAGTVGGTLTGTTDSSKATISLGTDVTLGNLVTKVGSNGVLKNYTISVQNITANVITSVAGTVQNFNVTTNGTMSAPLVGGDLGGNLINVDVSCASAEVAGGVLVNSVASGAKAENCDVVVTGEAKIGGSNAGGLTGSNAGTLSGNTVNIGTLTATGTDATVGGLVGTNGGTISGTTKVTVTTLSGGKTVGGLAGINSGSISGAEVSATINHTGNGGVTIGGIVGEMKQGSLTNSKASGSINAPDNLSDMENIIGGAIGSITGGAVGEQNTSAPTVVTTSVTVDTDWAGADNVASDATFGSSGITNNGPVGMFVGYAAGVTFTNCESTAANETYQFVGEATFGTPVTISGLWSSNVKCTTPLNAYSDEATETGYLASAKVNETVVTADMISGVTSCNSVSTQFNNCTFYLGKEIREQTYGADTHFYTMASTPQSGYGIGTPYKITFAKQANISYRFTYYSEEKIEFAGDLYYQISDNEFGKAVATITKTEIDKGSYKRYSFTITLKYYSSTGELVTVKDYETGELASLGIFGGTTEKTLTIGEDKLYQINTPTINNGSYLIVSGTTAVGENNTSESIQDVTTFDQRKTLSNFVYSYNGSTLTNGTSHAVTSNIGANYFGNVTDGAADVLFTVDGLSYNNSSTFQLYPVTTTENVYQMLTFTYYNENATLYQRQFVTDEYVGAVPATTSLSEETEIPAENGGETGNTN